MFEGVSVALVTPFRSGAVDESAFRALVNRLFEMGVDGVVATGSTGEAATLTREERRRVLVAAVEEARGRGFVVAGTGTNDTAVSIDYSRDARDAGVDGLMVVTPYYNKPSPAGLEAHYRAISEAAGLPILAYNVPGRTGYNLPPSMAARLAKVPNVVALKEASGSVDQGLDVMVAAPGLTFLSGEDSLTLPLVAAGARGVVSVAGHLIGDTIKAMIEAHERGDVALARQLNRTVLRVTRAMFIESNPGPVKYAMSRLG
ncbi:MAG: 4-hydroxy-tetrahydrodipicolinate synthase, partial [Candidatus Eisenbacteria bacterium]|nr:4-hydroxy-tetrahydrodipicolinate synthase [Candidatus Eisenbacteria bacterium]